MTLRKKYFDTNGVEEIIGTLLLLSITVGLFSIIYVSVLFMPVGNAPPSADIIVGVDGQNIIFSNAGGEGLSLDTQVELLVDGEVQDSFIVDDYLHEEFKDDDLWSYSERFNVTNTFLGGKAVTVNILDVVSNSLIVNVKLDVSNPLNTFVNTINPYNQNSDLVITARSTGASPDNVTLWYRMNWMWEDTFNNDDVLVSSYNNMSFSQGNYVVVNQSGGIGDIDEDYVDNNVSNVGSPSDIGTHSDFDNEKSRDSSYDTLTEENTASGSTILTLIDDDFEGDLSNWNTDWDIATDQYTSFTQSIKCNYDANDLISIDLDTTGASSITISFRYRVDDIDSNDNVYVQFYDGSSYNNIEEIGDDTEDVWLTYSDTINNAGADAQYFISNFRIKIEGGSIDWEWWEDENLWIDDVLIQKVETEYNYELDLEVQWTSVNYQLPTEILCIYANTLGTENIMVDAWNGTSWETVFSDLSTGWNNASVTTWLTSSTFTIRYKGGTETSDPSPDSWQIDAALLKLIDSPVDVFYEGNITSIDIEKPAVLNWRIFYADVNNTAYSTFSILDENNNVLLSGLDGNGNSISSISNDIIRLYGVFDGPINLDSWNVSVNSVGWTSFGINESGGLSWNFNFPEGTGYYYFYSIAKRENWDDESAPSSYDTSCYYNS